MATNELKVQVSVEKTIHEALATVLQEIADEHGIAVESLSGEWYETFGNPPRLLKLEMRTMTRT
jgi:hypothetical protein